eukprot:TRINITY_DN39520_c0_g1_i1.p1 TRINITY_DN39520_c0_g1~~TRINITY_DN39520_c0_g1_i1.p1  ORF type:complete len:376 (+),score=32.00 TRINITY_DN39520_c0_g1_i1:91-1128(+)
MAAMGMSDRISQGLAGPSERFAGLFGPLLALVSLALIFVGGLQFSLVNPACSGLAGGRQGTNICCAIMSFFVFVMMSSLALGPVQVALQLDLAGQMHNTGVCDWAAWRESGSSIYFRDGATELDGTVLETSPFRVRLEKCEWHAVRWRPCEFYVHPVFACSANTSRCREVCAWGIAVDRRRRFQDIDCGSDSSGGVCGISTSLQHLTLGKCEGPNLRDSPNPGTSYSDNSCLKVETELAYRLKDIESRLPLTLGSTSEMAPLLELGDPSEARRKLNSYIWTFFVLAIIYLPLPLLAAFCVSFVKPPSPSQLFGCFGLVPFSFRPTDVVVTGTNPESGSAAPYMSL